MSHGNAALSVVGEGGVEGEEISLALRGLVLLAQFHGTAADGGQSAHECASSSAGFDKSYCAARSSGGLEGHDERAKVID